MSKYVTDEMSEFTPTTERVRFAFIDREDFEAQVGGVARPTDEESGEAFDRWLAAHDREVAAQVLRDAADAIESEYDKRAVVNIDAAYQYNSGVLDGLDLAERVVRARADEIEGEQR